MRSSFRSLQTGPTSNRRTQFSTSTWTPAERSGAQRPLATQHADPLLHAAAPQTADERHQLTRCPTVIQTAPVCRRAWAIA